MNIVTKCPSKLGGHSQDHVRLLPPNKRMKRKLSLSFIWSLFTGRRSKRLSHNMESNERAPGSSFGTPNKDENMEGSGAVEDFLNTGRTGRRNAMPDIKDAVTGCVTAADPDVKPDSSQCHPQCQDSCQDSQNKKS
ncbi:uncharacterized protein LOC131931825 isoform X2 [Physella acuta]|uniref:uncharacterized protein LOC131931825 isoform X2 n=1 Tax=Physella acuta TaxID=109671 RepID=UPI0027DDD212|nr:uncharacterized protein LOC131931825 isoform X2 [Physella acuta]